jgi:hypothetical protein
LFTATLLCSSWRQVEKKDTEAKKELPPSEILAGYMATNPCLNFKNDHGYTVPPPPRSRVL